MMASEWAAKLYDKMARCRTNGEAKELLDAAAEEVASSVYGEIWADLSDGFPQFETVSS